MIMFVCLYFNFCLINSENSCTHHLKSINWYKDFAISCMKSNFGFSHSSNSILFSRSFFASYQHSLDFIKDKIDLFNFIYPYFQKKLNFFSYLNLLLDITHSVFSAWSMPFIGKNIFGIKFKFLWYLNYLSNFFYCLLYLRSVKTHFSLKINQFEYFLFLGLAKPFQSIQSFAERVIIR
jgi:hypothetical protein